MKTINIFQLGSGNVGRALVEKVLAFNCRDSGIEIRYVGLSNSRTFAIDPDGLARRDLAGIAGSIETDPIKSHLERLAQDADLDLIRKRLSALPNQELCIVDVSSSGLTAPFLAACADLGYACVLANKKPLVADMATFKKLRGLPLGCRATVGAGLPVIPGVQEAQAALGKIFRIEGCFSGTMGILCSSLEQGRRFSEIVREAKEKGITEPDPRDDLSGTDVARKMLIIARFCGYELEFKEIAVESLVPENLRGLRTQEFLASLDSLDQGFRARFAEAERRNGTLRHVGSLENGRCSVGLKWVPKDSPIGGLTGPEKLVVLHAGQPGTGPIVIKGKGAGADSASLDVLNDILSL